MSFFNNVSANIRMYDSIEEFYHDARHIPANELISVPHPLDEVPIIMKSKIIDFSKMIGGVCENCIFCHCDDKDCQNMGCLSTRRDDHEDIYYVEV